MEVTSSQVSDLCSEASLAVSSYAESCNIIFLRILFKDYRENFFKQYRFKYCIKNYSLYSLYYVAILLYIIFFVFVRGYLLNEVYGEPL